MCVCVCWENQKKILASYIYACVFSHSKDMWSMPGTLPVYYLLCVWLRTRNDSGEPDGPPMESTRQINLGRLMCGDMQCGSCPLVSVSDPPHSQSAHANINGVSQLKRIQPTPPPPTHLPLCHIVFEALWRFAHAQAVSRHDFSLLDILMRAQTLCQYILGKRGALSQRNERRSDDDDDDILLRLFAYVKRWRAIHWIRTYRVGSEWGVGLIEYWWSLLCVRVWCDAGEYKISVWRLFSTQKSIKYILRWRLLYIIACIRPELSAGHRTGRQR